MTYTNSLELAPQEWIIPSYLSVSVSKMNDHGLRV